MGTVLKSALGGPKEWARDFAIATFVGLFLAFLGPFDTYAEPLEKRLVGFLTIAWLTTPAFFPILRLGRHAGQLMGLSIWVTAPAACAVATLPVAVIVTAVGPLLWGAHVGWDDLGVIYFQMLAINVPVPVAFIILRRLLANAPADTVAFALAQGHARTASPVGVDVPGDVRIGPDVEVGANVQIGRRSRPRLFDRLPAGFGEILALQAEDHYVRVHARTGSALILIRLADAIAELDGLEGLQVHRSWWVAKGAVAEAKPEGRRMSLMLTNGAEAPVTRENVALLKEKGWV